MCCGKFSERGWIYCWYLIYAYRIIKVVSFHSLEDRLVKSFFRVCEGKRMDLLYNEEDENGSVTDSDFIPSISKSVGPFSPLEEEIQVQHT